MARQPLKGYRLLVELAQPPAGNQEEYQRVEQQHPNLGQDIGCRGAFDRQFVIALQRPGLRRQAGKRAYETWPAVHRRHSNDETTTQGSQDKAQKGAERVGLLAGARYGRQEDAKAGNTDGQRQGDQRQPEEGIAQVHPE